MVRPDVFRGKNDETDEDEQNPLKHREKQPHYAQQDKAPADNQQDNAFDGRFHSSAMMP